LAVERHTRAIDRAARGPIIGSPSPASYGGFMIGLTDLLWICTIAYGIHALEEFMLDWRDWAQAVINVPVTWPDFYVTNSLVVVLGICCAQVAARQPALGLVLPALMLINATFFHVLPMIVTRGRYSPGMFTAVVLFYPLGLACYHRALGIGLVSWRGVVLSLLIGAVLMATPIVLLHLRGKAYFRQN
jgi:hypothetical protein